MDEDGYYEHDAGFDHLKEPANDAVADWARLVEGFVSWHRDILRSDAPLIEALLEALSDEAREALDD